MMRRSCGDEDRGVLYPHRDRQLLRHVFIAFVFVMLVFLFLLAPILPLTAINTDEMPDEAY
jgi:type IV secretory pathway component VirB8